MLGKCTLPISSTQGKQRGEEAPGDHLGGEHGGHHDGEDGGEDGGHCDGKDGGEDGGHGDDEDGGEDVGHDHCGGEVGDVMVLVQCLQKWCWL